jgi:predicted kinase
MANTCTLIIITGLPCSGKSYLAEKLRMHFQLPLVTKDGIKERLYDSPLGRDPTVNEYTRAWSRKLGEATYEILFWSVEILLQAGVSCIAESNFTHAWYSERFQALQKQFGCHILQIQCMANGQELVFRFHHRWENGTRHPGHVDPDSYVELDDVLLQGRLEPLAVDGPYLEVDTTEFEKVDMEEILQWVESQLDSDRKTNLT